MPLKSHLTSTNIFSSINSLKQFTIWHYIIFVLYLIVLIFIETVTIFVFFTNFWLFKSKVLSI